MFIYAPFAKAIGQPDKFTYQDYLYELCAGGTSEKPVSEQQWEMICDIIGNRTMMYASNSKIIVQNMERKAGE